MKNEVNRNLEVKKTNNTIINSIMAKYIKYICAVLMVIGTSVSAWGTMYTDTSLSVEVELEGESVFDTFEFTLKNSLPGYTLVNEPSDYGYIVSELDDYDYANAMFYDYTEDNPDKWSQQYGQKTMTVGYYFDAPGEYEVTLIVKHQQYANGGTVYDTQNFTITFTVTGDCPDLSSTHMDLSTVTPTYNTTTSEWDATVSWDAVTGVTRYGLRLQYYDAENTKWKNAADWVYTTSTSYTITDLTEDTKYRVGVQGQNTACSTGTAGDITNEFTPHCDKPATTTLTTTSITSTGVTLNWTTVSGASNYAVMITNEAQNVNVSGTQNVSPPTTTYTFSGGLSPNTNYYAAIQISNACGKTRTILSSMFTTLQRYTITYYKNDGGATSETENKDHGVSYTISSNKFSRSGYTLVGWNSNSGGTGTGYDKGATYTGNANLTLYAVWGGTISFDANGGSGSMDAEVITSGSTYDLPASTFTAPEGKKFKCWAEGSSSGTERAAGYSHTVGGNITFYAIWEDVTYGNYVFACADISVESAAAGKALVTSRNGIEIMSANPIQVSVSGAVEGHAVAISSSDSRLKFYKKTTSAPIRYIELTGSNVLRAPLDNQEVYVSFKPTAAGTGAIEIPTFTISCDGESRDFNSTGDFLKVRSIPDAVAIAAKIGGTWHALSANITSSSTPKDISIYAATEGGILTAYGSTTDLSYKLWQVKTTNGTADRFGTYSNPAAALGERLRFAGKDDKALMANNNESSNKYNINNYAVVDAIDDDPAAPYEWKVTTTEVDGEFVYKLQTDQTNNTRYLRLYNGRWGTYLDGKGVDELYLLPVKASALVEMEAFEWGTSDVVVRYTPSATPVVLSKVTVGNTDIAAPTASMTNIGGDLWKLSGLSGLTSKPSEQFVVSLTENGLAKQGFLQIPFIVTGDNTTEQSLRTSVGNKSAIYNNVDVVIRSGGKLITAYDLGHFANLYIYPGGKAVVSNNMTFGTIFMRGGYSFLDNKATYKYPDLCVKAGTISSDSLVYDLYVDNRMYYKFSMPRDVTLRSVTDETGSEDFPVWVKHYNGATRASGTHVSGWEWYGDEEGQESFKAGVGYEITAKPKVSRRPLAIIRFPVKSGNITSDANDTVRVAVTNYGKDAYDSHDLAANNVGWNFVGNPYLTAFKATSDTSMIIDQSYEPADVADGESWDGTYKWVTSPARFVTVPYDMMNDFHHEYVKNCTIPAFSAFFIQVVESGTFRMAGTRTEAAAPWRYSAAQKEKAEMHVDVLLRGKNEAVEAKAGLIIHDKYEGELKDFEDVEQWFVDQNEQKTYTFANGTALAYNLLNEQAAMQVIPMGYIATAAGEHTYSLDESNDVSGLEHLWLTDNVTGVTTDLLVHGYTFTTEAGRYDERFAISAVFNREEVVTDIAGTGDDDWTKAIGVYHDGNTLTLRGLPENSSAYVYDMTGKLIASGQHLHNVASFNIAAQGVYNIRVVDGEKAVTLRSVLH